MKNILICVDGSEGAEYAVRDALEFNLLKDNNVFLFQVVPEGKILPGTASTPDFIDSLIEYNTKQAKEILVHFSEKIEGHCLEYSTAYVIGDPAEEILDFEKRNNIDLIVIGSRGLGKFSRTVLGSVSTKVSNNATSSVFISKDPSITRNK